MQKARGSALIIAILLVSAIGAISFGFGRVFLAELANATLIESGIYAHYAAESGLEEGFLRYRYNQSAEVPFSEWKQQEAKFFGSNITTDAVNKGTGSTGVISAVPPALYPNQLYDLRLGYIGMNGQPFLGHDATGDNSLTSDDLLQPSYGTGDSSQLEIDKDESVKINLTGLNFNDPGAEHDLTLFTKFHDPDGTITPTAANSIMELRLTFQQSAAGEIYEYKTIVSTDGPATCSLLGRASDSGECVGELLSATSFGGPPFYRWQLVNVFSAWRSRLALPYFSSDTKATLYIKPLFYDVRIGLTTGACRDGICTRKKDEVFPGPVTTINSTGHYGGVSRKIEAKVDRQSGTLYDLFDYVIYEAN